MTYKEAHNIIEQTRTPYNPYGETIAERMVYQGSDFKNASFQYFRNWDDEVTEDDMAVFKKVHPSLF